MRLIARFFLVVLTSPFILSRSVDCVSAAPLAPAPTISESFDVGSLHVDRYGTGTRPLVLIPGLSCGPWEWYGTIAHFAPSYAIYAVTLAGFDGRPAPVTAPSFAGLATDFDALVTQRKLVRPIIVGHSLGGTLAIFLGEREASRFAAIVAVDGLPVFATVADATPERRAAIAARIAAPIAAEDAATELAAETKFMSTIGTANPALVAPTAALEATSDPKTVAAWFTLDLTSDFRPDLAKVETPLLEVVPYDPGGGSPYTQSQTLDFYRSLLAGAPNLTLEPIPGARHFAMLDRPSAFYTTLDTFFASLH